MIDEHDHDPDRASRADRAALDRVDYRRWPPMALALSRAFWELPRRPDASGPSTHDIGIDVLVRSYTIRSCLRLMFRVVDEFDHQPTGDEVERIGRELFRMPPRLAKIRLDHRRLRQEEADRNQVPRLRRGPRAGG